MKANSLENTDMPRRAVEIKKVSFDVPVPLLKKVKARARKLDLDVSKYLRALVRDDLNNK